MHHPGFSQVLEMEIDIFSVVSLTLSADGKTFLFLQVKVNTTYAID
jgi:hypothetical protein